MTAVPPECSFEDLIQSDLFTFHIGEEKKPFVVHSKAVAATSEYFRALVTGDMAESQTQSAELQDILPEDFARYLEYAYRRDYTVPSWVQDDDVVKENIAASLAKVPRRAVPVADEEPGEEAPPPPEPEVEPEPEPTGWGVSPRLKVKKRKSASASFRSRFEKRKYLPSGEPKAKMVTLFAPQPNSSAEQDFTPIFLAHARLCTFAGMRLIGPLQNLALHKLHRTLLRFQPYHQRVGDIIQLVRYAYDNGKDRDDDGTIDELRKLVVEYIVCEVIAFEKHNQFVRLLEDGGEFVGDFWTMLVKNNLISTSSEV